MEEKLNNQLPDLAIVIVSWNTKDLLRKCLKSVYDETKKYTFEIWVVDNDSPDNSAGMVAEEFPEVKLIANKTNNGFAPANNQALRVADAKNYLLLNPDTVVLNGAIDKMLDYMYEHKPGTVTCKLLNDDMTLQKSVNNFFSLWRSFFENRFFAEIFQNFSLSGSMFMSYWDHNELREIDWAYGAVILFSREVYDKVGILDDRYYIYAEEMDFFMRVQKAGYKSVFLPDVHIIHYGKSSSRQRRAEMFIMNYKSFYMFLRKNYPPHVYPIYRARTVFYLYLWLLKFNTDVFIAKLKGKKNEEALTQIDVYTRTLQWHKSPESEIPR